MNNLSTLGVITSFVFSVALNGSSFSDPGALTDAGPSGAYVVNHSHSTIYYKPESFEANPGLDMRFAYPIAPGESLFAPVDAIATAAIGEGKIFRVPTGGRIIINENGIPEPANIMAQAGMVLYQLPDAQL